MPPMPNSGSYRHAETHDPSTVRTSLGDLLACLNAHDGARRLLDGRGRDGRRNDGGVGRDTLEARGGARGPARWRVGGTTQTVDCLANGLIAVAHPREILGMAQNQNAARCQPFRHAAEQRLLRLPIEVDHHIAAKNHVIQTVQRPLLVDQVDALEVDHGRQLRAHLTPSRLVAFTAQEVAPFRLVRDPVQPLFIVDATARRGQHIGINVAGHDLCALTGIEHGHRNGIRFLAGGTGRAPDAQGASGHRWQHLVAQIVEVMRLAKERGLVRRDAVDELERLGPVLVAVLQQPDVGVKVPQPKDAQPAPQPPFDELAFLFSNVNARFPHDEITQKGEVTRFELIRSE